MNKSSVSGKVSQIIGPVVDVFFKESLPKINEALKIKDSDIILEVQQHLGSGQVRTIAMSSTDGMLRGPRSNRYGRADHCASRECCLGKNV